MESAFFDIVKLVPRVLFLSRIIINIFRTQYHYFHFLFQHSTPFHTFLEWDSITGSLSWYVMSS